MSILSSNVIAGAATAEITPSVPSGITTGTFVKAWLDSFESKDGKKYTTLSFDFNLDGAGEYKYRLFEPTSAERTIDSYGRQNPSQVEQFFMKIGHLLSAINPVASRKLSNKEIELSGSFEEVCKQIEELCKESKGIKVKLKFLPVNGFNGLPNYAALISKKGSLFIGSSFIAPIDGVLELSEYDKRAIERESERREKANTESPSTVGELGLDTFANDDDDDEIPF